MTRRSSLSDNSALGLADASKDHSTQMFFLTTSLMYAALHAIYRFINTLHDECNAKHAEEILYAINYIRLFYKFYNLSKSLNKIFILQGT